MQNKKGKPVITPEMQEFGKKKFGIDLMQLNAIGTPSVTGIVTHIEPTESSAGGTQQQPHSSHGNAPEKSLTGGTETPTDGTQEQAGRTVQEPDKRPSEGTQMPSVGTPREREGSGENERVASLGFDLVETPSESSTDGTQEQPDSSLREPLGAHTDDTQRPGGTVVQGTEKAPAARNWGGKHGLNEIVVTTQHEPDPRRFWHGFITEGEVNCLFGRAGVGKSTIAVNVLEELGLLFPSRECVWFDLENSYHVLKKRATEGGVRHVFPENCWRYQPQTPDPLTEIEQEITRSHPVFAVLDNLSSVCGRLEDPETAQALATRIAAMASGGCTLLVIAHTPKLSETEGLGLYSLSGASKLVNVFPNIIAVAKCHDISNAVYVKHVRCRQGEQVFDGNDVAIMDRRVINGLLSMVFRLNPDGTLLHSPEFPHLKKTREQQQAEEENRHITELLNEGLTTKQISEQLGIPERTLYRRKKKL